MRNRTKQHGFTLIEIVVVILLLSIILGMVGINLTRSQSDILREEAERLVLLIQTVQQESVLQGRVFAIEITSDGYRFLRQNDEDKLTPMAKDDVLRQRTLPAAVAIALLQVDGVTDEHNRNIVLEPNGGLNSFVIVLRSDKTQWYVLGTPNGKIIAAPTLVPNAA